MKPIYIVALWATQGLIFAVEPAAPEPRTPLPRPNPLTVRAPQAWLGLRVAKPDEAVTAHVPSLPQGIGFVVKSIDENGPAKAAGLLENDLLWKIGDQMLVNEAQLATLLRLSKPGEQIVMTGFRGGKPLEVKLTLGEAPILQRPFSGEMIESAILPGGCPGPMRLVNVADKTASFSTDEGKAEVRREGETYQVKIHDSKGKAIYEGEIASDDELGKIPVEWRRRIHVLCRTLDQALDGGIMQPRQPRPRVVPPPGENL